MSNPKKIDEGNLLIKKAEKSLKTSFLKWNPDLDSAISYYNSAADCFKIGGDFHQAAEMHLKIAELYEQNKSTFYAAKAEEEAAVIFIVLKNLEKGSELILSAGSKYRINGTSNAACQLMQRMSKKIETDNPEIAAKFYQLASDAAQDTDNAREAGEFAGQAAKMMLRSGADPQKVVDCLVSQVQLLGNAGVHHEAGKALLSAILVKLYFDNDVVAANKLCDQYCGSITQSEDMNPLQQLLQAYQSKDGEKIQRILRSGTFLYLGNDYAKLARDLANSQKVEPSTTGDTAGEKEDSACDAGNDDIN